jgi:cysteine synthase
VTAFAARTDPCWLIQPARASSRGPGIVPPLLTAGTYDEARIVDEAEARRMALPLAREKASSAGTSSALNVVGAIHLAREIGEGQTVKCHDGVPAVFSSRSDGRRVAAAPSAGFRAA